MVEHMETNSPDRESAAHLLELADEARAATVHAAALPWWPFALEGACAGVVCGGIIVNAWVVVIIGIAMMTIVAVLLHRWGTSRGQHLVSPWIHAIPFPLAGPFPFLLRALLDDVSVDWFWVAIGYGMIASVVYFVALLLDERWRNRRLAEGRFEEYDIW